MSQRRRRTIFLQPKAATTETQVQEILDMMQRSLVGIDGIHSIEVGPQTNSSNDFTHAVSMIIDDEAALDRYRTDASRSGLHNQYVDLLEQTLTTDITIP